MNDDTLSFFIGDPAAQIHDYVFQGPNDTCAIAAQTNIINQFLEHDISLDEAIYTSHSNGWYHSGQGTAPDDVGKLMETYGIPTHTIHHANIQQLAQELQAGHCVVIGVNSSELWDTGLLGQFKHWLIKNLGLDTAQFNPADHAVVVTGIDLSDQSNPHVIINDSGRPDGAGMSYPLKDFMDAWENSDFTYTATDNAPSLAGRINFDIGKFLGTSTTLITGDPLIGAAVGGIASYVLDSLSPTDIANVANSIATELGASGTHITAADVTSATTLIGEIANTAMSIAAATSDFNADAILRA